MALVATYGPMFLTTHGTVKISSIHCSMAYLVKSSCEEALKEMSRGNRDFRVLGTHEFPCFICSVNALEMSVFPFQT